MASFWPEERKRPAKSEGWNGLKRGEGAGKWIRLMPRCGSRSRVGDGWSTTTASTPWGSRMCGKQRACGMVILDVWQGKELRAHFADVWQGKSLGKSSIDSKGFMAVLLGACLEGQIPKELSTLLIESKGVAGAFAFDNVEDWSDFPEVWQPKGLGLMLLSTILALPHPACQ